MDAEELAQRTRVSTGDTGDERLFRAVVEAAPYAMLLVHRGGQIALVNAETERLFGYDRTELIGQPLELLLPERFRRGHKGLRDGFIEAPQPRPMGVGRDLFGRRKDGSEVPMEVGLRPVITAAGPGVLAALTDITLRKQAEADLRRLNGALAAANRALRQANTEITQKNAEISRKSEEVEGFVYIVSHDLRAPLVNLQGFSRELELCCGELEAAVGRLGLAPEQLLGLNTIIHDDMAGTLRFIAASVGKFDRLINALLALSRTGKQQYRHDRLDVRAIAQATVDMLSGGIQASGARIVIGDLPDAWGDATAVGQVFANLVENALKYADPARPPEIEIGGGPADGMAEYWIKDNGVGIPPHAHARLFQVFQRFHPERATGDGIGLAAIKRIVERLGGTIRAEDTTRVGAVFRFTLPRHQPDVPHPC